MALIGKLAAAVVICVVLGGAIWFALRKRPITKAPPSSIVLLLRRPVPISAPLLAKWLSEELGRNIEAISVDKPNQVGGNGPARDVVLGKPPHLIAIVGQASFAAHSIEAPYVSDPMKAGGEMGELRIGKAVAEHKAWLSMDILRPDVPSPENYRLIARTLAHSVGDACLALYHPPLNRFAVCDGATAGLLRSEDPIQALFGEWRQAPVIPIDDDPRMKAAEANARTQFGRFEAAFHKQDGEDFSIKAAISGGGNTEHIWIAVEKIGEEQIEGALANDPIDLGGLKLGSKVTVKRQQVEDWVFSRGGKPVGSFTLPVIQAIHKERARGK